MPKNAPTHLKHKPIYEIADYDRMDGAYRNDSDVYALSVGKAQWDDSEFVPTVKVWRKKGNRWSRQSEETTFTRALDMAMLVIQVLDNNYYKNDFINEETVFENVKIEEVSANAHLKNDLKKALDQERGKIQPHVNQLYRAMQRYMKKGAAKNGEDVYELL